MSGALATNFFLEDYAKQHREAVRAKVAAEGRILSVENPEKRQNQNQNQNQQPQPHQKERKVETKKPGWWSSLHSSKKNTPAQRDENSRDSRDYGDAKSLHSFSSDSSY